MKSTHISKKIRNLNSTTIILVGGLVFVLLGIFFGYIWRKDSTYFGNLIRVGEEVQGNLIDTVQSRSRNNTKYCALVELEYKSQKINFKSQYCANEKLNDDIGKSIPVIINPNDISQREVKFEVIQRYESRNQLAFIALFFGIPGLLMIIKQIFNIKEKNNQ